MAARVPRNGLRFRHQKQYPRAIIHDLDHMRSTDVALRRSSPHPGDDELPTQTKSKHIMGFGSVQMLVALSAERCWRQEELEDDPRVRD